MTELRLFVYGSLKRGFANHARYCRGFRSSEPAQIEGRLFQMPSGYPVLRVAESKVLARGSGDLLADIETQAWLAEEVRAKRSTALEATPLSGSRVQGVVLTFGDPVDRLRAIDVLEEFRPGRRSRYERVLIMVFSRLSRSPMPAWTYIAGDLSPQGRVIPTGRWPSGCR